VIEADLLLRNATVITLDGPDAHSVAVLGDRIVAVDDEVPARRVVDLDGAVVVPGFHDAHNHMAWFGLTLDDIDARTDSMDALLDAVAAVAATAPGSPRWVTGTGYDDNRLGRHPHRDELDRAADGRPVRLMHASGHMTVVNSPILARLGLDRHGRDVPGGRIVVDDTGRPTGLLQEQAQNLVNDLVLPYSTTTLVDAIDRAGRRYLTEGVTSCTEAGVGGGWIGKSPTEVAAYQAARDQGRLHVRVELMVVSDVLHPLAGHADDTTAHGIDLGIRTGFGDDWLRLGPVKVFTDGSLIGHTAAMCHDYADTPGSRGYLQADPDVLTETILAAHRSGWRVAAHAIGDAAIDLVLDAYERAQRDLPRPGVRHRIEHFGVPRPDQIARAAALGVVPVPQGRFIHELGDGMLRALGPDRAARAYPMRSLLDAGIVLPGSSDRPVVTGAPLAGMHDMVNRTTAAGLLLGPGEAVTGREALYAYTYGSAHAAHRETDLGTVTVGKLADLVVLEDDPTRIEPHRIRDIRVRATMIGGRFRWP
jgi:predicted amidohydrolase YtcJ